MLQQLYLIDYNIMSGTMQDRLNIAANVIPPNAKFTETDTGNVYIWNGAWIQQTPSTKILPGSAGIGSVVVSSTPSLPAGSNIVGFVSPNLFDPVSGTNNALRPPTADGMAPTNIEAVSPSLFNPVSGLMDRLPGDKVNGEYVNIRRYPDEQAEMLRTILDELRVIVHFLKEGLGVQDDPDAIRIDISTTTTVSVQ